MRRALFGFLLISEICFAQSTIDKSNLLIDTSVNLYAFVGQQMSLTPFEANYEANKDIPYEIDSISDDTSRRRIIIMDQAFIASYKVLQPVFNDLNTDTVSFKVFDHYGRPSFSEHATVLLYISKSDDGKYYFHQKYMFDPVKQLRNAAWVGKKENLCSSYSIQRSRAF